MLLLLLSLLNDFFVGFRSGFPPLVSLRQRMCSCENERCENEDSDDPLEILAVF